MDLIIASGSKFHIELTTKVCLKKLNKPLEVSLQWHHNIWQSWFYLEHEQEKKKSKGAEIIIDFF